MTVLAVIVLYKKKNKEKALRKNCLKSIRQKKKLQNKQLWKSHKIINTVINVHLKRFIQDCVLNVKEFAHGVILDVKNVINVGIINVKSF